MTHLPRFSLNSFFGLFICTLLGAQLESPAQALDLGPVVNCNSFWKAFNGTYFCREVNSFSETIQGAKVRFFRHNFDGLSVLPPAQEAFVDWTKAAIKASFAKYSTFGNLTDITFILVKDPHPQSGANYDVYAEARPLKQGAGEACPITLYPETLALPEAKFEQMIAHELYHCFQGTNFHDQLACSEGGSVVSCDQAVVWWAEGSADFFSNLVYPSANIEFAHIQSYDAKLPIHLQTNAYATAAFFQSLANHAPDGAEAAHRLVRNMAKTDKLADHQVALAKNILIANNLQYFARDLVAGTITDSGGGNIPTVFNGELEPIAFDPTLKSIKLTARPFTAKTAQMLVPAGYQITLHPMNGVESDLTARASVRKMGSALWKDLGYKSAVEDFTCQESDSTIEVLVTSARSTDVVSEIEIQIEIESKPCGCKPTSLMDPCMLGEWKLSNDLLAQASQQLPDTIKMTKDWGTMSLNLASDQLFVLGFQDLGAHYEIDDPTTGPFSMDTVFNGYLKARLGVTPENLACIRNQDDQTELLTTVYFPGSSPIANKTVGTLSGGNSESSGTGTTMTCQGGELKLNYTVSGSNGPIAYEAIFKKE